MEAAFDFSRPIIHESERYEFVRKIGAGSFGEARLMKDKLSGQFVAIKYLERGDKIDKKVQREIINHRSLRHPNIIAFKEVVLTPTHLAIVMEYAPGGELFDRIRTAGKLCEDEARFFFQQLISGVSYCHKMGICHRDLKLENVLLDGSPIPRLKICDFGYSKSSVFNSLPRSTVGTPAYVAPEVLQGAEYYDGKVVDVWSCGVTLYVMLFGTYPFVDPENPNNIYQMFQRILTLTYSIPRDANLSNECLHLISRIFVLDDKERITIPEIKKHEWYLKNLPEELRAENEMEEEQPLGGQNSDEPMQSNKSIKQIVEEATIPDPNFPDVLAMGVETGTDSDDDDDDWLVESSGELVTITSLERRI